MSDGDRQPALAIRGLTKVYAGDKRALDGIDLTVETGDFFALLGPNGAGKSTTIGILASLVNATAGSVEVFGHDLARERGTVKASIGLVPQEFNFSQFEPVGEIVVNQAGYYGIPRAQAWEKAESLLRRLGLWDRRRDQARKLSGGMKRRLLIARALVHEPRLLILDEPTAGVDIELRRHMWQFLRDINAEGTTVILTTHYLEEAEHLCRNIAIIDDGRIITDTSVKELLSRLDVETFVLNTDRAVGEAPTIPGYTVHRVDATTLEAEVPRAQGLNRLFAALGEQGIEVVSMRTKTNRLEELFVRLTEGEESEAEAPAPA
ncbi:ABC transporter ATP-binding protein [Thiohalospira sp.]|uniref:ABC transporter ATP-binding protein n=1 Tax=Thiohalospira sp. TaxID=3080549 RepID=UPI003981009B